MTNAVITLQIGQCGNQIGFEFWKNLCAEHGISPEGQPTEFDENSINPKDPENRSAFFYQSDEDRCIPRAALFDLEPRVLNCIARSEYSKLFSDENVCMSPEGGGAGNNWAVGYSQANHLNEYFEIIERLAEDADTLAGFMLCHSLAGGTGSGAGSFVMEQLVDRYPKCAIQTFSVFPNPEMSDVVVQAYNSVLSLERLAHYADSVIVLDNAALQRIVAGHEEHYISNYDQMNTQIINIMNMFTNPLRFPTFRFSNLRSLIAPLVPTKSLHFLTTSFTPWMKTSTQKMTLQRIMRDLLRPCNVVVSARPQSSINNTKHGYFSILDIIRGSFDSKQLMPAIINLRKKHLTTFVPWAPIAMQVALVKASPYMPQKTKTNAGLMLSNYTGVCTIFDCLIRQFDRLRKRNAFLAQYKNTGVFSENFEELDSARENVKCLIEEYEASTERNFRQWSPREETKTNLLHVPSF